MLMGVVLCTNTMYASAGTETSAWTAYNSSGSLKYRMKRTFSNFYKVENEGANGTNYPTYISAATETNMVAEQGCGVSADQRKRTDGSYVSTKTASDYAEDDYSSSACSISTSTYYFKNEKRTYNILAKSLTYGNGQH